MNIDFVQTMLSIGACSITEAPMPTYRQVQDYVRLNSGFVPKTCWIAHVLSDHGLTKRQAHNRHNENSRVQPCPPEKREAIETALKYLGAA